jgi:hypothetical protein
LSNFGGIEIGSPIDEAMVEKRLFRDPDKVYSAQRPSPEELLRTGQWDMIALEEMGALFRAALSAAVEAGLEHCPTSPSTSFGTRAPIANYQRD